MCPLSLVKFNATIKINMSTPKTRMDFRGVCCVCCARGAPVCYLYRNCGMADANYAYLVGPDVVEHTAILRTL